MGMTMKVLAGDLKEYSLVVWKKGFTGEPKAFVFTHGFMRRETIPLQQLPHSMWVPRKTVPASWVRSDGALLEL